MSDQPQDILARYKLAPAKRRGQNFLLSPGIAEQIVNLGGFTARDMVVEVGVGLGALTSILATRVNQVVGVEIDRGLIRYHAQTKTLPENVVLRHEDVLKTDFHSLFEESGGRLKIIANLPYSISNPFVFKLLEHHSRIDQALIMVQREVAQRLTASPGTGHYGIPTVLLGRFARVEQLLKVGPEAFYPRPKVDSTVIRIIFDQSVATAPEFDAAFQRLVRTAFANRRKTLANNLSSPALSAPGAGAFSAGITKTSICRLLERLEIPPRSRAETLTGAQFKALARAMLQNFDTER